MKVSIYQSVVKKNITTDLLGFTVFLIVGQNETSDNARPHNRYPYFLYFLYSPTRGSIGSHGMGCMGWCLWDMIPKAASAVGTNISLGSFAY